MAFRIGLKFDAAGWEARGLHQNALVWQNAAGDGLGLYQIDRVPDLPARLEDAALLLERWPDTGNGVVHRVVIELDGLLAVKAITKHRQTPSGLMYIGSWIIPRARFSYVIKLQCHEYGVTGQREAIIADRNLANGAIMVSEAGSLVGWSKVSGQTFSESWMYPNLAEAEAFDTEFPEHPLSRVRSYMSQIEPTVRIEGFVKRAAPFDGPRAQPWWRFVRRS